VARVVVDPAVFVSAFISPLGNPAILWQAVRDVRIEVVVSPGLLDELATVLHRPRFRRYGTTDEADVFVAEVGRYGHRLPDSIDPPRASRDPNDDYLVALAATAEARALVSGDRDLTEMVHPVLVLTPAEAVAQLL
jgi:putative PIN family toxin of toxin-antitoxin system